MQISNLGVKYVKDIYELCGVDVNVPNYLNNNNYNFSFTNI